ncbi:MAG TPA: DJ-1/PfpI family protein [Gemmatimonadales bacterium]|nr:DJ-1/PfpI family protein [Gemmatimonadales bacterium]
MPSKAAYVLVVPGFADWEPAHALAELRRHGGYRVEVVGLTMAPVESMGGLTVQPKRTLADVDLTDVAAFILPGGDRWESSPMEPELAEFLHRLEAAHIPLAAICAATVAITRAGLLHGRRHTSNGQNYLRHHVPGYEGAGDYVDAPAVRDRGLITASGLADVEFAAELLSELDVLSEKERRLWVELFRGGRIPARVA